MTTESFLMSGKRSLRILMAAWDEEGENLLKSVFERGGHFLAVMNPKMAEAEFLSEAVSGGYDVVVLTNLGLSPFYILGFVAPIRQAGRKVVILSGYCEDDFLNEALKVGATVLRLPASPEEIEKVVEPAVS